MQECSNEVAGDTTENVFNVINAFEVPKLTYSLDRKKFLPDHTMGLPQAKLFAGNCFLVSFPMKEFSGTTREDYLHQFSIPGMESLLPFIRRNCLLKAGSMYGSGGASDWYVNRDLTINRLVALHPYSSTHQMSYIRFRNKISAIFR